jgi:hypothetical protein
MLASAHYNTGDEKYCVIAVKSTVLEILVRDRHIVPSQKLNDVTTTIDTETKMKCRRRPSSSRERLESGKSSFIWSRAWNLALLVDRAAYEKPILLSVR